MPLDRPLATPEAKSFPRNVTEPLTWFEIVVTGHTSLMVRRLIIVLCPTSSSHIASRHSVRAGRDAHPAARPSVHGRPTITQTQRRWPVHELAIAVVADMFLVRMGVLQTRFGEQTQR